MSKVRLQRPENLSNFRCFVSITMKGMQCSSVSVLYRFVSITKYGMQCSPKQLLIFFYERGFVTPLVTQIYLYNQHIQSFLG